MILIIIPQSFSFYYCHFPFNSFAHWSLFSFKVCDCYTWPIPIGNSPNSPPLQFEILPDWFHEHSIQHSKNGQGIYQRRCYPRVHHPPAQASEYHRENRHACLEGNGVFWCNWFFEKKLKNLLSKPSNLRFKSLAYTNPGLRCPVQEASSPSR